MSRKSRRAAPSAPAPTPKPKRFALYGMALLVVLAILAFVYFSPENPDSLYQQAQVSLGSDPAYAAELAQRAVVARQGDYPDAHLVWCRALAEQQLWDEALGCFGNIAEPQRCEPSELIKLADAARQAQQTTLEKLALEAADKSSANQPGVLQRLVALKYADHEYHDVLRLCKAWQRLEPNNAEPLEAAMSAHVRRAEFTQAAEVARQILRLPLPAEKERRIRIALVGLLVDLAETEQARQELDRLLADGADSPELRLRHAQLLRLERRFDEALTELQQLPHEEKTALRALLVRGTLYFDVGQFEKARDDLSRVIEQYPENKEAHYKLAQALLRLGKPEEAQKHLKISQELTDAALRAVGGAPASQTTAGDK